MNLPSWKSTIPIVGALAFLLTTPGAAQQPVGITQIKDPNSVALAASIKARRAASKGDREGALAVFNEAINVDQKNPLLYIERGTIWASKGDYDRALADYDEAIKLQPGTGAFAALALMGKGWVHSSRGDLDLAISAFDQAIKIDPDNAETYGTRGDLYRTKSEYARAVQDYDQAISRQPENTLVYANRALARFFLADLAGASEDFKRVVDEQSSSAYHMLLLYVSNARTGRRDARDELARGAAKLTTRGWPYPIVEFYLGKRSLQSALATAGKPDERCEAHFYIGEWQLARGARSAALKALQAAAETCPKDFIEYQGAVAELKRLE